MGSRKDCYQHLSRDTISAMSTDALERAFSVEHLDISRLLTDWRWLCADPMQLVARNAFGDLFLADKSGHVFWLDVAAGKLTKIANSQLEFRERLSASENRNTWLAEADAKTYAERGFQPNEMQCIGFATPLIFAESADVANNAHLTDIYDHVGFLGTLHKQICQLPTGAQVRLGVGEPPKPKD